MVSYWLALGALSLEFKEKRPFGRRSCQSSICTWFSAWNLDLLTHANLQSAPTKRTLGRFWALLTRSIERCRSQRPGYRLNRRQQKRYGELGGPRRRVSREEPIFSAVFSMSKPSGLLAAGRCLAAWWRSSGSHLKSPKDLERSKRLKTFFLSSTLSSGSKKGATVSSTCPQRVNLFL